MAKKKIPSLTYECVGYLLKDKEIDFKQIVENIEKQYGITKRVSNVSYAFSQLYKSDLGYFMIRTGKGGGKDPYRYKLSEEGLKISRKMAYRLYLSTAEVTLENIKKKVPKLTENVDESNDMRDSAIIGDRWKQGTVTPDAKKNETKVKPKAKVTAKAKKAEPKVTPKVKKAEPKVAPKVKKTATKVKPVKKEKTVFTIVPTPEPLPEAAVSKAQPMDDVDAKTEDRLVELLEKLLDKGVTIRHSLEFNFKIKS